ncbi:MAG: choice-of-anchor Q domain-containing protein [Deltaproteobacteria bacterium]
MNTPRWAFRLLCLPLFLLTFSIANSAFAIDRFVAKSGDDQAGANTCSDPLAPCLTIQQAVDSFIAGDRILVARGQYNENVVIDNLSALELVGGFPFVNGVPNFATRNPAMNITTINGASPAIAISLSGGITVSGFVLQNGTADPAPASGGADCGGAIVVDQSSDITLVDIVMNDNFSSTDGGGFCLNDSTFVSITGSAMFNRCIIEDNNASGGDGGGGFITGSDVVISNCSIRNNEADGGGGGLFIDDSVVDVNGSTVGPNNRAGDDGAGIFVNDSAIPGLSIDDSVVLENVADDDGGGLFCDDSSITIDASDVVRNTSDEGNGGGLATDIASLCTITVRNASNISENVADQDGGGMHVDEANVVIEGSNVNDNVALDDDGGGISAVNESVVRLREDSITGASTNVNGNTTASNDGDGDGGGLHMDNSVLIAEAASSELGRTNIVGNISDDEGGGISAESGSALDLTDVNIIGNFSEDEGGGIEADEDGGAGATNQVVVRLVRVSVEENQANGSGGGLACDNCEFQIRDSFFFGNDSITTAADICGGGAIGLFEGTSNGQAINTFFAQNTATGQPTVARGGAICMMDEANMTCTHCTISDNRATSFGGGVYVNDTDTVFTSLNSNIIFNLAGTPAGITEVGEDIWCDAAAASSFVTLQTSNVGTEIVPRDVFIGVNCVLAEIGDNISSDPDYFDAPNRNYRLTATSPAINAGSPASVANDFEGDPRFSAPDIGADEFRPTEAGFCADGEDNDSDGTTDCNDSQCIGDPACVEAGGVECSDGIDNDNDGNTDCLDSDCFNAPDCQEGIAFAGTCADGVNNNPLQNLVTDCGDPQCAGDVACPTPTPEPIPTEGNCSDGVDGDGDGAVDCDDLDCDAEAVCDPTPETNCSNGIDDDGDGPADCTDPDCAGSLACAAPGPETNCSNGIDDDGDGPADCFDSNCAGSPACAPPAPETACDDNFDNDGDGFSDCDDPNCDGSPVCNGGGGGCSIGAENPKAESVVANMLISFLPAIGVGLWMLRRRVLRSN